MSNLFVLSNCAIRVVSTDLCNDVATAGDNDADIVGIAGMLVVVLVVFSILGTAGDGLEVEGSSVFNVAIKF